MMLGLIIAICAFIMACGFHLERSGLYKGLRKTRLVIDDRIVTISYTLDNDGDLLDFVGLDIQGMIEGDPDFENFVDNNEETIQKHLDRTIEKGKNK